MNEEINKFIISNKDETEYFLLNENNTISLEDYIKFLKSKEEEFTLETQNVLERIKEKCNWVYKIGFGGLQTQDIYFLSTIYLITSDGTYKSIRFNTETQKYEFFNKKCSFSEKIRMLIKYGNNIKFIQEELSEIDIIGKKVFNLILSSRSVSNNFKIYFLPFQQILVYNDCDLLADFSYYKEKRNNNEQLNESQKNELLKRVRIKH